MLWAMLGLQVGLYILNRLLSSSPATPTQKPAQWNIADTQEGVPVPYVYGVTSIDQPVMVWHGNEKAYPPDNETTVQYSYGVDMIFVLGVPAYNAPTYLRRIWWGDKPVVGFDGSALLGDGQRSPFLVNLGDGVDVVGEIQFHAGSSTQNVGDPSTLAFGCVSTAGDDTTLMPGYRNQIVVTIACSTNGGATIGASPQVPQIRFEVASGVDGAVHGLPLDANPMAVIQDLLTGPVWKIGLPSSDLDAASFAACTTTLRNEQHGFSGTFESAGDAAQFLGGILGQINGMLFQSSSTGLVKARLARFDYDPTLIPQVSADNVVGEPQWSTTTFADVYNQVRVTYRDRDQLSQQGSVAAQNLSVLGMLIGRFRTLELQYPGVATALLASKLAVRDLAAASRPIAKVTCTLDRAFYALEVGDLVRINWPKYGVVNKVMRAMSVDLGQLADRGVAVQLVEDVFNGVGQYGTVAPTSAPTRILPLTDRFVTEAPRYLALQLASAGTIPDPDAPLVLAMATPDDNATQYEAQSYAPSLSPLATNAFRADIPRQLFPITFTLVNDYARIYEPYDTSTGLLVITNLENYVLGDPFESLASTTGAFLLALVTPSGQHEIVSFESVTNLGGSPTQFRLNNVWRALLDTVPLDHSVGERGWFLEPSQVGRRSYNVGQTVDVKVIPSRGGQRGSGEDPFDALGIAARALRPYPAANQGVGGDAVVGTLGLPAVANRNKVGAFAEEGLDIYGTKRDRNGAFIIRGDATDDTITDTGIPTYQVAASVAGATVGASQMSAVSYVGKIGVAVPIFPPSVGFTALRPIQRFDGFGSLDVGVATFIAFSTIKGKYGIAVNGSNFAPWSNPSRTNVFMPSWRNLLSNVRWNYQDGAASGGAWPPPWSDTADNAGTAAIGSGSTSLSRLTSGNNSYYLGASGSSVVTRGQVVPLGDTDSLAMQYVWNDPTRPSNWQARGLMLIAAGYFRNNNSDGNDTVTLAAKAFGYDGSFNHIQIGSNSTTVTPPPANWAYTQIGLVAPSGTIRASCVFTLTEVAAGGGTSGVADTIATEMRLFAGQFANNTTTLLTNPSFEAGTTASWTVDSGAFLIGTGIASPSANYAQGGANATNQLHQDFALPVGFEYGTAILRCFRAQLLANDAGTVTVQVLDGLNNVLASSTTGSETMPTLNAWYGRTLYVDTVDGAAKIRVIFIALRSLGSGNSGAAFDEANLMFAKHLDASSLTSLTFDTPTVQHAPATWQEYHGAYPTNPVPDAVFTGLVPSIDTSMEWSDGTARAQGKLCGQFGGGVTSVNAYPLTRAVSPNQINVQPAGAAAIGSASPLGSYTLAGSFSALCMFRVDEPGFASACGLFGRMNASRGWGINLTAAGQLQAMLRGAGGTTKSVASGRAITEGALHLAAVVYDASAHTLSIYDEHGLGASVSTASGLGDFASLTTDADVFLRIGTDATDHDSLPGQIGQVYLWGAALTAPQVASHWSYAKDPTGLVTTYTRTAAAIVPLAPDAGGDVACVMAADQVALAYHPSLTLDAGTGYGLAVGKSATNLLPDVNFAGANWVKDASTTLTQGIVDPTGRPRGVQVAGDASNGFYGQTIPLAASPATVPVVFWARSISGSTALAVVLQTSAGTLVNSAGVTLTTLWKRFTVTLSSWAGATANCRIRFLPSATATFQLAGIAYVGQGTDVPAILPLPSATHGNYNATLTTSLAKQFVYEGELIAQGVSTIDAPTPAAGTLVQASAGTNVNLRELQVISGSTGFRCVHYDAAGTPAHTDATTAYSTYSSRVWKARARWALCGMLDNVALPVMSAVAWTDDTHATPTEVAGRTAAWTIAAANLTTVKLGAGTASPSDAVLRLVTLRAREEKLP